MNETDPSIVAASRPHRLKGDETDFGDTPPKKNPNASLASAFNASSSIKSAASPQPPGLWSRIKTAFSQPDVSLRQTLQLALQGENSKTGSFSGSERTMLANVLKLSAVRVEDVMVPRVDIEAADDEDSLGELVEKFRSSGHSRLPLFSENLDNIVGMIHIKDALQHVSAPVEKPNGSPIKLLNPVLKQKLKNLDFAREVLFVPPSMPVSDLLQSMQATRLHMAIVVDEYGGTDGLVSIEDLLEAVVGDIEDEHDDEELALVIKQADNVYIAEARASLEELQKIIGTDFDPAEFSQEADTLGGLVFALIDRIPVRGEVITQLKGFEFEILQADPRRVKKVRILRRSRKLNVRAKSRQDTATEIEFAAETESNQQKSD